MGLLTYNQSVNNFQWVYYHLKHKRGNYVMLIFRSLANMQNDYALISISNAHAIDNIGYVCNYYLNLIINSINV